MTDPAPITDTTAQRFGDWILTASGRKFYPFDAIADEVDLLDIVHALSHLNRWTGHTNMTYNVAQHAVMVATMVEGLAPDLALAALHHDDAEAYLGDVASPIKRMLRIETTIGALASFADLEDALRRVHRQGVGGRPAAGGAPPGARRGARHQRHRRRPDHRVRRRAETYQVVGAAGSR